MNFRAGAGMRTGSFNLRDYKQLCIHVLKERVNIWVRVMPAQVILERVAVEKGTRKKFYVGRT